jgi:hypothetical protein
MIRIIRRALREWKREFLAFWSKFSAFHRIVIAIILAMAIVYAARSRLFDPLQSELTATMVELDTRGVPLRIPDPHNDEVVQDERLRSENLRRSIENHAATLAVLEEESGLQLAAGRADANAALLEIAARHDLHVLKNSVLEAPAGNVVRSSAAEYELLGSFKSVYAFLQEIERAPYLWELQELSISRTQAENPGAADGDPALVRLRFTLIIHLYHAAAP